MDLANDLSHFEPYFHLFAAGNFAWAGSKKFREAINDQLLKSLRQKADGEINKSKKDIDNLVSRIQHQDEIKELVRIAIKKYDRTFSNIEKKASAENEFVNGFQSMFLISALYCLFILLVGAYHYINLSDSIINNLLITGNISFILNMYIFFRSFSKHDFDKPIPWWQHLIFSIVLIFFYHYSKFNVPFSVNIGVACFTVSTPFLLHFIKVYLHNYKFKLKTYNLTLNTIAKLEFYTDPEYLRKLAIGGNSFGIYCSKYYHGEIVPTHIENGDQEMKIIPTKVKIRG